MIIKTLLGTVVLIMFKIFVSYGQDVAQQQLQIVIKDTSGKALEGVYMVNKTQQYLITSSNEEGYCYYDKEVVNDTDSVVFLCLGFVERVIGGAELITTQELRLIEKVYELENITVKSVKPDILLKKAAACMQKHAEKVKKNYNYYGKAQYIKITECHGKAVEYRNLYGVFFTSGNIPKKDVLDEDYRWDFVPAFGAQSLSWTADGKDTLIRRRLVSKNNKKVSGNYDAGNTKFFLLMRSIMLYGPLFTNLKYYDFQLTDNRNGYTYRFRTKPANSLNKMRIRCYGTLTIDPETARLRSLKLDYVDYNMCYLVWQTEWIRSPYVTIAQMQFNYAEDGLPYVENCEQKTIWEKQQKYEKPDRAVLGKTPSRRGAAKHSLVEKEFLPSATAYAFTVHYGQCEGKLYTESVERSVTWMELDSSEGKFYRVTLQPRRNPGKYHTKEYFYACFSDIVFSGEKLKMLKKMMSNRFGNIPYFYAPFEKEWWDRQPMPGIDKEKLFRDLHVNGRDLYQQAEENGLKLTNEDQRLGYRETSRMRYSSIRNIIYPYLYEKAFK